MNYDYLQNKLSPIVFGTSCFLYVAINLYLSYFIANEYFITSLSNILEKIKIGSNFTGIIMLNFCNGIPELITYLIIGKNSNNLDGLALASMGSFLFVMTVALGLIILFSSKITHLDFTSFYNNFIFVGMTYCFFVYLLWFGTVSFYTGLIMVLYYGIFIISAFFLSNFYAEFVEMPTMERLETKTYIQNIFSGINKVFRVFVDLILINQKKTASIMKKEIYGLISPILFSSLVYFCLTDGFNWKRYILVSLISSLVGCFIYFALKNDFLPLIPSIYTLVGSCFLIFLLSTELLVFFNFLAKSNIIPIDFSYAIIIPIGNSLGDLITGIASSRKGMFRTAANSCMTASVYNTFFGLGLTIMYITWKNKFKTFNLGFNSSLNQVLIAFIPLVLINVVMNYEIRNRKLSGEFAWLMLLTYVMFSYFCVLQYKHYQSG